MVHAVLDWLGGLPPAAVYPLAALLVFAETGTIIGVVLPGEVTLLFVGFLAYRGSLDLTTAIVTLVLAALIGDAVAFVEGRRLGPRLRTSRLGRAVGHRRWDQAEASLARNGGGAVFLARFIAVARTITPRLAGMSDLAYLRVLPWDALGVLGWVGGSIVVGYLAGSSYARVADVFGRATTGVLLLGLTIAALVVLARYVGRHRDPVTAFGGRIARVWPLRRLRTSYIDAFDWLRRRLGSGGAVAVNLILGVLSLLGIGVVLTWVVDRLVSQSGIPLIDPLILGWFAGQRTPAMTRAAMVTLSMLRGSFLVVAVGLIGILLNRRPRAWRTDLLGVLGTVGAFVPLLVLAVAAEWARSDAAAWSLFTDQGMVVTASLGMLAWLLTRRLPWAAAVPIWFVAIGAVLLTALASLYVGRAWPSEVFASVLLGSLWVLVFVVAWRTRRGHG
ncbi:MAG: VTT domain-containing protein [Micromonosporaceae bacterium]